MLTRATFLLISDPAYQQNVPNLDGGEECSDYVIHGTNVDLGPADSDAEQLGTESPAEGQNEEENI